MTMVLINETFALSFLHALQNVNNDNPMFFIRLVKKLTYHTNSEGDIWANDSEVI
jgi:hypothetical protein